VPVLPNLRCWQELEVSQCVCAPAALHLPAAGRSSANPALAGFRFYITCKKKMKLKQIGEFEFIKKISSDCLVRPDHVVKAIGDDAAAFYQDSDTLTLVTTDMLVERIHFLKESVSGFNLGYKSLAVNLSDIAAMGGTAGEAFVCLAIPEDCSMDYLEDFYLGIKTLAKKFKVNILGGDTTGSKNDLIINISVVGSVPKDEIMKRDGAKPGDVIYSAGFLGDSRAGLNLILNNIAVNSTELKRLRKAHLLPEPQLEEGRFLAQMKRVHSAIDISDGLSSDLYHILCQSRRGAKIYAEKIPVSKHLEFFCSRFGFNSIEFALSGGEDYKLLFTVSPAYSDEVAEKFQKKFNRKIYPIGRITESERVDLILPDGGTRPLSSSGWDHFKDNDINEPQ